MSGQYDFFGGTPPHVANSETSQAAAADIKRSAITLRGLVLDLLRAKGPLTDEEIQEALSMNPSTQRPRRVELVQKGFAVDSGQTKPTRSGRRAVLWAAVS